MGTDTVVDNVCNTRSVQECITVPKSIPIETPVEECHQVARQVCHPVAEKVARQVCQDVAVAVATPVAVATHAHVASPIAVAPIAARAHVHSHVTSGSLHGAGAGANYAYGDGNS